MPKLGILIHTFLRDEKMVQCVNSVLDNLKVVDYKIYLSDGGIMTDEKEIFYKKLENLGHKVMLVPFDFPPQVIRNYFISIMKEEEYVLKMDDDFVIDKDTKITETVYFLEMHKKDNFDPIDLLGMSVKSPEFTSKYIFDVENNNGNWTWRNHGNWKCINSIKGYKYNLLWHYCDMTPDCWIARTSIFPECNYDEKFHVGEGMHADFFLNIKYNTDYKVAYCTNSVMKHLKHGGQQDQLLYRHMRHRKAGNETRLRKKWNIQGLNRYM